MKKITVSVVIPVYNAQSILPQTLQNLSKQKISIPQIFLVDDKSTDNSLKIIITFKKNSTLPITIIKHANNKGLAVSYNSALGKVHTTHVILLMQDCIIKSNDGIKKLIQPFQTDPNVVLSCSKTLHPIEVWKQYNFWQKCLMARHVGTIQSGRNNSFCCYSMKALRQVGLFDKQRFRTAGEDVDMLKKIGNLGKIVDIDILVEHHHTRDTYFSWKDYMRKENQRAEAVGATFTRYGVLNVREILRILARPLLIAGLFFKPFVLISVVLILLYSYLYTKNTFQYEWRNPRILVLPFVNIYLLFSWVFYFFRGLITGRQKL